MVEILYEKPGGGAIKGLDELGEEPVKPALKVPDTSDFAGEGGRIKIGDLGFLCCCGVDWE